LPNSLVTKLALFPVSLFSSEKYGEMNFRASALPDGLVKMPLFFLWVSFGGWGKKGEIIKSDFQLYVCHASRTSA